MEKIFAQFIMEWGPIGVIIIFAMYIIYGKIKADISSNKSNNPSSLISKLDNLSNSVNDIKSDVKIIENNVNTRIQAINQIIDNRLDFIEAKINQSSSNIINTMEERRIELNDEHNKRILHQINITPTLHDIFNNYLGKTHADHILLGTIHNGNNTLNGIPYCKFDIVLEKYIYNKATFEYSPIYKNVDLMLHGRLPSIIVNYGFVKFNLIDPDDKLEDIDPLLYNRARGQGIHQIAFSVIKDKTCLPIGTIICIKYDDEPLVDSDIEKCANEVSQLYFTL